MVISGFQSPFFHVCIKAAPASAVICLAKPNKAALDELSANLSEPLVFICANYQEAISFFNVVPPKQFFGAFRNKKTLVFADASKPFWQALAQHLLPYVDAYATADCVDTPMPREKWVPDIFMPIPESDWASSFEEKSVNLAFYGSITMFKERRETVDFLRMQGMPIDIQGGQENEYALDYLEAMRKAKITLNFSNCNTREGIQIHHVKGRIWEAAMSRTVIVETCNPATTSLFTNDEIIWFENKEELPQLLNGLLADQNGREAIANRMFKKATQFVKPEIFWGKLC